MKKKMLLFGGSGLLGSRITNLLSDYTISAPTHSQVDLTDRKEIEETVLETDYNVIVYSAGISNQDFAEENHKITMTINKTVVEWIAELAKAKKTPLIYFSTDAVFSGIQKSRPYSETDTTAPVNYYGETKLAGEEVVLSASKDNLVLRLISLYTGFPHEKMDFARFILKKLSAGEICYGITDQIFNPGFVDTIVNSLQILLNKKISHIVHLGATDYVTNYQFTNLLAAKFSLNKKLIKPITFDDFFNGKIAKRGQYARLDTTLAQKLLGKAVLNTNQENIDSFYKQITEKNILA